MRVVKTLLPFPVAMRNFTAVSWRMWMNKLMPYPKLCRRTPEQRRRKLCLYVTCRPFDNSFGIILACQYHLNALFRNARTTASLSNIH